MKSKTPLLDFKRVEYILEASHTKLYCLMASETNVKSGPRDIFLHLLNMLTFYVSAVSFITLWIKYINALFPDRLDFYHPGIADAILWSTSILVVALPVRLLTSWILARDFAKRPERREFAIRKWLVYLTLFVSSITIIGDLVTLVYNFLKGALTLPFFLKILVVLITAVAVFAYFLWDLRSRNGIPIGQLKTVMMLASAVVIASVIGGFLIVGSPATQRDRRFDERRTSDLSSTQNEIISYWMQKGALPATLEDLRNTITGFAPPTDPETDAPYEYRAAGPLSFELCATFSAEAKEASKASIHSVPPRPVYFEGPYAGESVSFNWAHDAGRTCFSRAIDPDFYPKEKR